MLFYYFPKCKILQTRNEKLNLQLADVIHFLLFFIENKKYSIFPFFYFSFYMILMYVFNFYHLCFLTCFKDHLCNKQMHEYAIFSFNVIFFISPLLMYNWTLTKTTQVNTQFSLKYCYVESNYLLYYFRKCKISETRKDKINMQMADVIYFLLYL